MSLWLPSLEANRNLTTVHTEPPTVGLKRDQQGLGLRCHLPWAHVTLSSLVSVPQPRGQPGKHSAFCPGNTFLHGTTGATHSREMWVSSETKSTSELANLKPAKPRRSLKSSPTSSTPLETWCLPPLLPVILPGTQTGPHRSQ